jgi:predicted acylesterase/phospholipase RssA
MAAAAEGPIVAVDVGRKFGHVRAQRGRSARIAARWEAARAGVPVDGQPPQLPTIKETLARSLVLGSIETAKASRQRADVVVEPDTGACEMLDFGRLDEMVAAGRRAAREALAADPALAALAAG